MGGAAAQPRCLLLIPRCDIRCGRCLRGRAARCDVRRELMDQSCHLLLLLLAARGAVNGCAVGLIRPVLLLQVAGLRDPCRTLR